MKNRINLKSNNKGSGIVTVLIAVVLLTLMGSLLLMLVFTGFEMNASDRAGKQNTYDASTVMDEIRVGIEEAVSDSIKDSYTYALNRYSEKGEEIQAKFAQNFVAAFKKSKINEKSLVIYDAADGYHYNVDAIKGMIVNCRNGEATVVTSDANAKIVFDIDNMKITFKNVEVSYTNGDRITNVSADINVSIPDIGYSLSQFSVSGVPSFSAIVGGTLKQDGINSSVTNITGGAYMENLELKSDSRVILKDGVFVCRNNADISGSYQTLDEGVTVSDRIIVDSGSTFWANNIILRDSTSAEFLGNTYVANDLNFAGKEANLVLSGTYTGFGTGGEDGNDASKSSSILVNGKKNKIDLQGLSNLVLSGFSFIGESTLGTSTTVYPEAATVSNSTNVQMGESLSVKDNQKIYLVPDGYLSYVVKSGDGKKKTPSSNPDIFPDSDSFTKDDDGLYYITIDDVQYKVTLDTSKTLWKIGDKNYTYASYNAKLKPVCMVVSNQLIVYYFITFTDSTDGKTTANENANQYFKDYASAHPTEIKNYIEKYINVSTSNVASQTMGNFFVDSENMTFRQLLSNSQSTGIKSNSAQYSVYFSNVCQTLSYTESSDNPDDNPFTYYINTEMIEDNITDTQEFKDESGTVSAVVVNGDYTYDDSSSSDIHLIIATGNVNVEKDFVGLIFCGEMLNLDADTSLTANSKEVEKAYACTATVSGEECMVGDFFKVPIGESGNWGDESSSSSGKSVASLVTYSNWKKN